MLSTKNIARFSELRSKNVDTNLVTYHLKSLMQKGFVIKLEKGYALDSLGLAYVNRMMSLNASPHVVCMLLIQNSDGQVLLRRRDAQPFIGMWTLPFSRVDSDDSSVYLSAERLLRDEFDIDKLTFNHVGDCYVRVTSGDISISTSFVHILRGETDAIPEEEALHWVEPRKLPTYDLAPAIEQVIARSFFGDEHFFAEFEHDWLATRP